MNFKDPKVLGLILARGGSKGLPRKNLLDVAGKPLIGWTIQAALNSETIDKVILSSDDDEIIAEAELWGCEVPFRRPSQLASDTASSVDVVLHAISHFPDFDFIVMLQPTSPLRTAEHIDEAFRLLVEKQAPSCVSVGEMQHPPHWIYELDESKKLTALLPVEKRSLRRQDLPPAYLLNGAIYISNVDWLTKKKNLLGDETVGYAMSARDSLDIDTIDDLKLANFLIQSADGIG
ncbi:acylneuraminate cytidylyltransferase family protein [Alphaproteobacteria bacterium]|nr:acylneuraminate cytidylyltransferase family protein [Alphaproteobacteria bacterium]